MSCSIQAPTPHHLPTPETRAPPPSFLSLLPKCSTLTELKQIQAATIKCHLQHHTPTITNLINFCTLLPSSCMAHAQHLFDQIPDPDVVLFNTMFRGYARSYAPLHAVSLFSDMLDLGIAPDGYTFPSLIKACSNGKGLEEGRQVHGVAVKLGFHCDEYVSPTLIIMYAECGEVVGARRLFDRLGDPCVVSYNAMITGYARNKRPNEALALFTELQEKDLNPTYVTMLCVLSSCALLGALELGKWIHDVIRKQGFDAYVKVNTALIDMYAKCGSLEDAVYVFEAMGTRDT